MASVVVAEDNLEHQHVMAAAVRRLGHDVILTADGRAGLAAVREHRPDLVIADLDMPHLDGLQLCERLHADPELARIPVVLVTAYLSPGDPQLDAARVAAVVRKPFTLAELGGTVEACLATAAAATPPGEVTTHPAFLDALLTVLDTGVVACDTTGRMAVFNPALSALVGEHGGNVMPHRWPEGFTLHRHDGSPMPAADLPLVRALAGAEVTGADLLAYDPQQRPRWLVVNARPVRDERTRTIAGAVAAVHDVTAEHRTRQYQQCLAEVLRILASTPESRSAAVQVMQAMATELRWPYVRLWLVDPVSDRLHPAGTYTAPGEAPLPLPESFARGVGLAGLAWEREDLVWVPDIHAPESPVLPEVAAATRHRAAGAVPLRSGDTVTGVLTFFAAERQEADAGLAVLLTGVAGNLGAYLENRRAQELALHLAASTDEYVALVGHELRTPLTSISTYTDLIAESPDDTPIGEVRDLLAVVRRNNTELRRLVDDLLELAALESGHGALADVPVDLNAVVAAAVQACGDAARARHVTIRTDLPDVLTVSGDAARLQQVAEHLLRNAIGYGPEGGEVQVALRASDGCADLTVSDDGIGVPDGEQDKVFRRLYRGGNARHRGTPGSGLGLAWCRVVVERHHGSVTLRPRQPAGTTVTVRLPRL